jgi:hypothetical protein
MGGHSHTLANYLKSGPFLAGVARGRWRLMGENLPNVFIGINARDARCVVLRFDCAGYPHTAPTATVWDLQSQQPLPGHRWPRGGRVSQVFNPAWKNGAALYIPCDRQSIDGHVNWYAEYPWLIWKPEIGLSHYIQAVHEVLQSHELIPEAA